MQKPQTIQIFLPDGSPSSIQEAEITNRLIKAILFPRNKMEDVAKREIINFTGVYFLFGSPEDGAKNHVYIGEGEDCFERIKEHHRQKDFWTHCIVVSTKTNEYTKSEAKFLEHYSLKMGNNADRYHITNSTGSHEPSLPESRKYDLLDNFETISLLLSALGYPIFESRVQPNKANKKSEFYINFQNLVARAIYTDEGMVVLKGSEARKDYADSFRSTQVALRQRLLNDKIIIEENNKLKFVQDYIFPSPSAASDIIKGNSSNGWIEWKNKDGKTLDEVERK